MPGTPQDHGHPEPHIDLDPATLGPGRDPGNGPGDGPGTAAPADPARAPDPGTPTTMLLAVVASVVLFLTVAFLQNQAPEDGAETEPAGVEHVDGDGNGADEAPAEADGTGDAQGAESAQTALVAPPGADQFSLTAKLVLKLRGIMRSDPTSIPTLDNTAVSAPDQVRMVVVAAEFENIGAARERITNLREQLDADDPLQTDLDLLARIYSPGTAPPKNTTANERGDEQDDAHGGTPVDPDPERAGSGADAGTPTGAAEARSAMIGTGGQGVAGADALTDDERQRLLDHHGWFGEVALSAGLDDDHPDRVALFSGGFSTAVFLGAVGLGAVAAFLAGCVLLVIGVVMLATGRLTPRMPVPRAGGSVYVETFAIFVAGFLALKLGAGYLADHEIGPPWLSIALQWSLVLVLFWPLLRGMDAQRWRGTVGLHTGRGLWREVGCGVLAYLAGLPLYVASILLVLLLQYIFSEPDDAPPSNPLVELIASAPVWVLVLIFTLATVWAPLVEEVVFRGGLYRAARSYMPVWIAAIGVGVVFAFMHNYGPLLTPPLIALGVVFAVMREWRGSLVAPIAAHFLHNATVMTLLLTMIHVMDL